MLFSEKDTWRAKTKKKKQKITEQLIEIKLKCIIAIEKGVCLIIYWCQAGTADKTIDLQSLTNFARLI